MLKVTLYLLAITALMATGAAFGQVKDLAEQLMNADEKQFTLIFPSGVEFPKLTEIIKRVLPILTTEIDRKLPPDATDEAKETLAKRQANAAVVLVRMNQPEKVWQLLKHSPDPRARSYLIHRIGPLGVDSRIIIKRLEAEPDITIRRALILSLGEFDEKALFLVDRTAWLPKLQEMYRTDADPGLHSAVEWLLRQWKQDKWLKQVNEEWAKDKEQREKLLDRIQKNISDVDGKCSSQWYVTGQGQTMVVIPGPVEFVMGSPMTEVGRQNDEKQHKCQIARSFAIASKELTREQFARFKKERVNARESLPTNEWPVNNVTWHEAVEYCNWLSEQEGISEGQLCYRPNKDGAYADGMTVAPDYLKRLGYRLPTEAEWEYGCRAGAVTQYSFGESHKMLGKYSWYGPNSSGTAHPVGLLKPNDLGLFDFHGNVLEWSQDLDIPYAEAPNGKVIADSEAVAVTVDDAEPRLLRGGSFQYSPSSLRSAYRSAFIPTSRYKFVGFRLARTLPPVPLTALPLPPEGATP